MIFHGFKKVTLIDYPDKIACTLFTYGCNLRCPYCHNPELVINEPGKSDTITDQSVIYFLQNRQEKLDGVVFTGGEPLIHTRKLIPLLKKIKQLRFFIKIDTNGTFPSELKSLIDQDLVQFVAMDFKCSPEKYPDLGASKDDFSKIEQSLDLLTSSHVDYEIRTTVVPGIHDDHEIKEMMKYLKSVKKYVIQNFVPNGTLDPSYKDKKGFDHKQLTAFQKIAEKTIPEVEIRNDYT